MLNLYTLQLCYGKIEYNITLRYTRLFLCTLFFTLSVYSLCIFVLTVIFFLTVIVCPVHLIVVEVSHHRTFVHEHYPKDSHGYLGLRTRISISFI